MRPPTASPETRVPFPHVPLHAALHPPGTTVAPEKFVAPVELPGWQLSAWLGAGSHAAVYAARPAGLVGTDCDYAIKLMQSSVGDDHMARRTFVAEAQLGKQVSHPNLIPVLSSHLSGTSPFLVLPRLEGTTARTAISACTKFSVPQSLWVARQVAQALQAIHLASWTHGDVKPDNIFLSPHGHCTLFDLGFATPIDCGTATPYQALQGSLSYMAPELLISRIRHPAASDIYSLGVTLFELLTGRLPFESDCASRLVEAHLRQSPLSLRHYLPNLSQDIAQLVQQMLAKSPERRPTAEETIDQLKRLEIATFSLRYCN